MIPPLAERRAYVETLPWVRRLKKPAICTGWHHASEGKRACKNLARWSYRHVKGMMRRGETGYYCWAHVMSRGLYGDMDEEARTEKWIDKHPPPWMQPVDFSLGDA